MKKDTNYKSMYFVFKNEILFKLDKNNVSRKQYHHKQLYGVRLPDIQCLLGYGIHEKNTLLQKVQERSS